MIKIEYRCPRCGYLRRAAVSSWEDWEPVSECCPQCGATELVCTVIGQGAIR